MSLVNQFNSTCLSFFNFFTQNSTNVKNSYIREYIIKCHSNDESVLLDQFVINILPFFENVKNKELKILLSSDFNKIFQNKVNISTYLNDGNIELIFTYLELLCNISIEYLKIRKLI